MITVAEVYGWVISIQDIANDDEAAHFEEDRLRTEVLAAIADGAEHPDRLAAAALTTKDITFSRWYA